MCIGIFENVTRANMTLLKRLDNCATSRIYLPYVLPVVIVAGSISNGLTVIVFRQQKLKYLSISFYLYMYSLMNLINIYWSYFPSWLPYVIDIQLPWEKVEWLCCLYEMFYRIISYSSIWILVAMILDRYISMYHPNKANVFCQIFIAKITVYCIFIGLLVVSVHSLWSYSLDRTGICRLVWNEPYVYIWRWVSASFYVFAPLLVLFVMNIVLLFDKCTHKDRPGSPSRVRDGVPVDLTNTVLALSMVYTALVIPGTLVNIVDTLDIELLLYIAQHLYMEKVRMVTDIILMLNPITIGIVCLMCSVSFRKELKALVRRGCKFGPKVRRGSLVMVVSKNHRQDVADGNETFEFQVREALL